MNTAIKKVSKLSAKDNIVLLANKNSDFKPYGFSDKELKYVVDQVYKKKSEIVTINRYERVIFVVPIDRKGEVHKVYERARTDAFEILAEANKHNVKALTVVDVESNDDIVKAFVEGLCLSNYRFLKYFKDAKERESSLQTVNILASGIEKADIDLLNAVVEGTLLARDLVNEPLSYLTAPQLSKEIQAAGKKAGFNVEVFNKSKIESLKMGGLLAVNKGSVDPPTFNILEWKPAKAKNKKPIVFVGKGVVYDTGGLSLKPTKGSMDMMKCDMGGAAAVAGALYAIAKAKLPVHVIGLIPATDNRPGGNAYAPGDVIKMHNGMTVEVLNTDAEGRMILADALSYAQKYEPEMVIDLATLTGAAVAAIGKYGIVAMGTASEKEKNKLKDSGRRVYERLVEFPFWDEYGDLIKSEIADIKNIGGPHAGSITAGKFLEKFTQYPWMHFDIAGPAWVEGGDNYRGKGGTGVGVRILFDYIKSI